MTQAQPRLVTFGISHFCEKARWALDWHGITHEEISWPPGVHQILARRCGAKGTTLPILFADDTVIQGSGAIIDWADQQTNDRVRKLTLAGVLDIERRADDVIGFHVRRLAYAEILPRFAHLVKPELFRNASPTHRLVGNIMWPVVRRAMMRVYQITPRAALESRSTLEGELDWLDSKLGDGRAYLAGDQFSRADITVASLLAPFARPPEMPVFHEMSVPDALVADFERWSDRPIIRWVGTQYQCHRAPRSSAAPAAA